MIRLWVGGVLWLLSFGTQAQVDNKAFPSSPDALLARIADAASESSLVNEAVKAKDTGGAVRLRAIRDAAQVYGMQAGRVARWQWLLAELSRQSRTLDKAFPFHALLIDGKLQPPVLDAGEGISRITNDGQAIHQVKRMYRVKVPARFVHTPLSWRDFLQPEALSTPVFPRESLLPRDDSEMAVWASVLRSAWNEGIYLADEELGMRIAALEGAFSGMVLYDLLALRGMIEPPQIAHIDHSAAEVTPDGRRLAIGGQEELVARTAYFVGQVNQWKPIDLRIPKGLLK